MRPLLVGECNPYGADPAFALYPLPEGATGDRLQRLVMGISTDEYLRGFDRVNLCTGKWSIPKARAAAEALAKRTLTDQSPFVLLGAKVAKAFGWQFRPFTVAVWPSNPPINFALLPHPSGRNLIWNQPGAYERARGVLRQAGVLPVAQEPTP